MNKIKNHEDISLYKWIWHSYVSTALVPLIIVELIFVSIYFISNSWYQEETVSYLKKQAQNELDEITKQETDLINQKLFCITNSVTYFSDKLGHALSNSASLPSTNYDILTYSEDGGYYTRKDNISDVTAVFYNGISPINEKEKDRIASVLTQQGLMAGIKNTQPLITSIYFNSFDSLNVIYPYVSVTSQKNKLIDAQDYNFYYKTNGEYNTKNVEWRDIYWDNMSNNLITSVTCPVYNNNFMEGFAGINITMDSITNEVSSMNIPWNGYGLLVKKDGTILTLSSNINGNLESIESQKNNSIQANPNLINLYTNNNLASIKEEINNNVTGFTSLTLNGKPNVICWDTISDTNWKLLVIVPEENIYYKTNNLKYTLVQIGLIIISGLIVSYFVFFIFISRKSKKMSYTVANSLLEINSIVQRISDGDYTPKAPKLNIKELKDISSHILSMGRNLGETNKNLLTAQSELKKKETDLKALINSIKDIIVEVDSNGKITNFWSRAHNDLYKVYEQGYFNSISEILDKKTSGIALKKIHHVIQTKEIDSMDFNIESNSGLIWFQAYISPRLNNSDKVVISARDVTDQKKLAHSIIAAKDEAEKASKAKSEFLSSMSHELRTPLNAILGFSQILELDPESPLTDSQGQSVKEILKAGNHLLELINEVLDLAKIESGKLSISIESVLIKSVMEETFALIKPFADQYGIKIITYPILNSNEFVYADHTRLKQILVNLLSNAIKYNKQNGEVIYYYDRVGDKFRFHVIDTGIGLSASDLDLIFKPFQRLNQINNAIEGTGIGLAVAKQLAELMDGKIHVTSEKAAGSHFWVEFPCIESATFQDSENIIPCDNQNSLLEDKAYTVLYVEDNPANLRLVERILNQIINIKMISATSGELCLDLAIAHKPDIILLDINLPGIDGFEVFKNLKRLKDTSKIPVIAISAHAMPRDIEKGLKLGFTDYITKPIHIQSFIETISNTLINPKSKDDN